MVLREENLFHEYVVTQGLFSGDRLRPIFTIASFCPTVFSPEMLQATDLACLARKLLREKRHYGINEQHICRF